MNWSDRNLGTMNVHNVCTIKLALYKSMISNRSTSLAAFCFISLGKKGMAKTTQG